MFADDSPLTPELLSRFERALFEVVPAYAQYLRPGLSEIEILESTQSLPGRLPAEAVEWWKWRDGIREFETGAWPEDLPMMLGQGECRLSSLAECIRSYSAAAEIATRLTPDDPDETIPSRFFPIDDSGFVSIELSETESATSQVLATNGYVPDEFGDRIAATFGEYVLWWTEALETGALTWIPGVGWQTKATELRPGLTRWGLT